MKKRYVVIIIAILACICAIAVQLYNLQMVSGEGYLQQSKKRLLRSVPVEAPRGELLDRYGRAIVTNREGYSVQIQRQRGQNDGDINNIVRRVCALCAAYGVDVETTFPIELADEGYVFVFDENEDEPRAKELSWKEKNSLSSNATPDDAVFAVCEKYSIERSDDWRGMLTVAAVRYEMEQRSFSLNTNFTLAKDVGLDLIAAIKENSADLPGVNIVTVPIREYPYGSLAAHILGRTGSIDRDEYEELKSSGYGMNDSIGKQGLEKYLESYLRGVNGAISVEQTEGGKSVNIVDETAPVIGRSVTLTIDLDLQRVAQEVLESQIREIRTSADRASNGAGARCGAVVVMDVNTGEILAMASYPTYDPSRFGSDYSALSRDTDKPLLNRAIAGAYAPGSTFKMLTATAALEEGVISPYDTIVDQGVYTYYKDYQPRCWIYSQAGATHGAENVSEAIRDSCNYFFYDVGRRTTIENIEKYGKLFGFGQKSGIELSNEERSGQLAGIEERTASGGIWYPGDTLATAIGQSDTLLTPLQLCSYISTLANGGTRYRPHLVKSIMAGAGEDEWNIVPEAIETINISKSTYNAVTRGMRMVVTEGTARNAFAGCSVDVAAKTGSAQLGGGMTNGVFVAYAPYDNPQIAVATVVEKAGSGGNVAPIVRTIIESYFASDNEDDEIIPANTLIP